LRNLRKGQALSLSCKEKDAKTYSESRLEDKLVFFNGDLGILDLGRDHRDFVRQRYASWYDVEHSSKNVSAFVLEAFW
jgi:hypothetical protein